MHTTFFRLPKILSSGVEILTAICPGPADGFLKLVNIVRAHGQTTYVYQVHKAVLLPTNLS